MIFKRIPNLARWAIVTAAISVVVAAGAYALFSAQQSVPHSVSVQGAHDISLFDTTNFTFAGMAPGDTVRGTIGITNNDGADVSVSTAVLASNADGLGLRDQLVMTVRDLGNGFIGANDCTPGDPVYEAAPIVYTGALGADPALAIPGMDVVLLTVAPDKTHGWCLEIHLPVGTTSAFANAMTDGEFTLTGID